MTNTEISNSIYSTNCFLLIFIFSLINYLIEHMIEERDKIKTSMSFEWPK